MARGKYETQAKNRRIAQLEEEVAHLKAEVASLNAAARAREQAHAKEIADRAGQASHRAVEHVQRLLTEHAEELGNGIAAATWRAQRVAMTEHLTWLFFKGFVTWDRFRGDREVLTFLATHGDLKAWFTLSHKYGHRANYRDRRAVSRQDPIKQMLAVLVDIDRAEKGNKRIADERRALDDVVESARDAFVKVELSDVLTDQGWMHNEPTEEDVALHREILDSIPALRQLAVRVE